MMTIRTRLRRLELTLIRPSPLLVRSATIVAPLLVFVASIVAAALELAPPNYLRALAYFVLALITRALVN